MQENNYNNVAGVTMQIYVALRHRRYCFVNSNQLLHIQKDDHIHFVGGPNTRACNKIKMAKGQH